MSQESPNCVYLLLSAKIECQQYGSVESTCGSYPEYLLGAKWSVTLPWSLQPCGTSSKRPRKHASNTRRHMPATESGDAGHCNPTICCTRPGHGRHAVARKHLVRWTRPSPPRPRGAGRPGGSSPPSSATAAPWRTAPAAGGLVGSGWGVQGAEPRSASAVSSGSSLRVRMRGPGRLLCCGLTVARRASARKAHR